MLISLHVDEYMATPFVPSSERTMMKFMTIEMMDMTTSSPDAGRPTFKISTSVSLWRGMYLVLSLMYVSFLMKYQ